MCNGQQRLEALLEGGRPLSERSAAACTWLDENLRHDPKASRELIRSLLPQVQAAGERIWVAWLEFFLGWLDVDFDDFQQGLANIESSKAVFEDLGDREGVSRCLNALGVIHHALGVYDLALDCYRESEREADRMGRRDLAGTASMNIVECLADLEEHGEALQVFEHCQREYLVAPHNAHLAHSAVGRIYRALGRLDEAEREMVESIRMAGGALHDALEGRQVLAEVFIDQGRLGEAEAMVAAGLEDCAQTGERLVGARFHLTRARLVMAWNQPCQAVEDIEAAILAARDVGSRKVEADAEKALYLAWQACGESGKALAAFFRQTTLRDAMRREQTSRHILGLHEDRARREARHFENLFKQVLVISEIGQHITANLNLDAILETLHEAINKIMDAPSLLIALMNEEDHTLDYRLVIVHGMRQEPFRCDLAQETMGCWCVRHRREIVIGDFEAEFDQYVSAADPIVSNGRQEKSLVFLPLFVDAKVVGMVSVQSHIPHAYDKRKVEALRAIGGYLAIALENARLYQRVLDSEQSLQQKHLALIKTQEELKHLHGIIPICASCKKIRTGGGAWLQLESYIRDHSDAEFTHGICPECAEQFRGDLPRR
jgi:tetratricopeptide (TPR) repeat protein